MFSSIRFDVKITSASYDGVNCFVFVFTQHLKVHHEAIIRYVNCECQSIRSMSKGMYVTLVVI